MIDSLKIKETLRQYILEQFAGKKISALTDDTPLIDAGILDSISTMQLVVFIEQTFKFEFEAHEVDKDNFANIAVLADFISKKL